MQQSNNKSHKNQKQINLDAQPQATSLTFFLNTLKAQEETLSTPTHSTTAS